MRTKFERGNWVRKVSFEQFFKAARDLEQRVREEHSGVISTVTVIENRDINQILFHNSTGFQENDNSELSAQEQKEYALSDLTKDIWRNVWNVRLSLRDNSEDPYMITLMCDKERPRRLQYYGQSLDPKSQQVLESYR